MKILFSTSEAGPFLRSGGLGDVASALPKALSEEGQDIRVIMPYYSDIPDKYKKKMEYIGETTVELSWRKQYAGVFKSVFDGVTFYFIDNEYYFKRAGLYGYYDDGERFAYFSKAVFEVMKLTGFYPDILHCNDWQTALSPLMLDAFYRQKAEYANIKTVLTIHNIEFQGNFDKYVISDVFGLPESFHSVAIYNGEANSLKAGIESCNVITTVSETYAQEIMTPYYAHGLETILQKRSYKIKGIVNGIDTILYNPLKDMHIKSRYSIKSISRKRQNKYALQKELGLEVCDKPLIGMVTRLTKQKGLDLVINVLHEILNMDTQVVVLGTGDKIYEDSLRAIESERFDNRIRVKIAFSNEWASKIYAGTDMFLMPSKAEPCGLSQLIALRYGSIPIVRSTGGLKDTIKPFNETDNTGNGFDFLTYNAHDMLGAVERAIRLFYQKDKWNIITKNALQEDYSWKSSAKIYLELYKSIK